MKDLPATSDFVIRPAARQDCGLILELIHELAEYERLSHEVKATESNLAEALFGEQAVAEALIGDVNDAPIGYALMFKTFSTFTGRSGIYLEDIYIRPAWRRRGYGEKLFRHVIDLARARGCGRLEWSVLNWNQPAIDFYQGLGARPMDDWTLQRISFDTEGYNPDQAYHQG